MLQGRGGERGTGAGSAEKGGEKIKPVGKFRIADRAGKYELGGNTGGQC